ncbi:MAG: transglycosylase SLT domain-containing protein [bacterium]|nr:transglycosylase SLT domain-containing protein [bacterium]
MKRFCILIAAFALTTAGLYAGPAENPTEGVAQEQASNGEDLTLEELAAQEAPAEKSLSAEESEELEAQDREAAVTAEIDGKGPAVNAPADLDEPLEVPEIPTYSNKKIEAFIHMYTHRKRDVFEEAIQRSAVYLPMIQRIFKEEGLPANLAFLAVVESNFNPTARSHANALGLWQFMSYTGRTYGLSNSWWHDERFDPEKSTHAAAKYLKALYKEFGEWELALAAYNSGSGRVRGAIRRAKRLGLDTDYWSLKLPRETRGYVPTFFAANILFSNLEAYGFDPLPEPKEEVARYGIAVPGGVSLTQVAKITGFDAEVLAELNPAIPKGLTPAHYETYEVHVPEPYQAKAEEFSQLENNRTRFWKYHRVRRGDTLWDISRRYGIPMDQIVSFNRLSKRRLLRINQRIMLPVPSDYVLPQYRRVARSAPAGPKEGYVYHEVQPGESLWSISQNYNVSLSQVKNWNRNIARRWRHLRVGEKVALKLPKSSDNI